MKGTVTEFGVGCGESVTACLTLPQATGECFGGPVSIGIYPGQPEIWIDFEERRLNVPIEQVNVLIRQLKRALKLARENS